MGTDINDFEIIDKQTSIIFNFSVTEPSFVYLDIYELNNKFVKRVADTHVVHPAKKHSIFWNLRRDKKLPVRVFEEDLQLSPVTGEEEFVPDGTYKVKLVSEATYSSRSYFTKMIERTLKVTRK